METKEKDPLVSVCIPVYNGGTLIHRALESCIHQSYRNIEVVVMDNASTDTTAEVVKAYAARDPRIRYFRNPETIRIMPNFYRSFEEARGEYVQHCGHDDWLSRTCIEEAVARFNEDPSAGVVMHRIVALNYDGKDFTLAYDNQYPEGRHTKDYILKHIYDGIWGGLSFFSLMRRADVLATKPFLEETYVLPKYGKLFKDAQATDWTVFLGVMSRYDHFVFTNRGPFVKLDHPKNEGKFFGFEAKDPSKIFSWYDMTLRCVEFAYSRFYPGYIARARVFMGADVLTTLVVSWLRSRCSMASFSPSVRAELRAFFANHTAWQRSHSWLLFIPRLVVRLLHFVVKPRSLSVPHEATDWFMDPTFHFIFERR